jgi:glycosyltransferase involved in cell wall biosynthesis
MRLLLITGTFPPGRCGVGDYVSNLAQGLADSQHIQVAVLTQRQPHGISASSVEVLGEAVSWRLRELPRLVRRIRAWNPDLVHIHWPSQGFGWRIGPALLPAICKVLRLRVVQTWHEPWPIGDFARFVLQRRATDGLIFVRPNFMDLMPRSLLSLMPPCPRRVVGSAGALPVSSLSDENRARLRERYLNGRQKLVVFFGFVHPAKGVEQLLAIADPHSHTLVIAGAILDAAYHERLQGLAQATGWGGHILYTGYLQKEEAADLLRAADAVVLPFLAGGGDWNTSIHGALAQGTLVITTSSQPRGDDPVRNLYTARISDTPDMKRALHELAGRRVSVPAQNGWTDIARVHAEFYGEVLRATSAR